jgi:hypothetical protein
MKSGTTQTNSKATNKTKVLFFREEKIPKEPSNVQTLTSAYEKQRAKMRFSFLIFFFPIIVTTRSCQLSSAPNTLWHRKNKMITAQANLQKKGSPTEPKTPQK